MTPETIGFVGLGRMGRPMAGRLVAAGYRVVGCDAAGVDERLPTGADAADSLRDLAAQADTILLSVPDGSASQAICREIVAVGDRRVRTVIDLSTIGIAAAEECARLLEGVDVAYVDAPVSGGVAGATSGSLAMMAAAPVPVFARLEPMLAVLARNRFRVGDVAGQGQAMKLLNNYISAAALAATCEATVFGAGLGLDLTTMVEVLNVSTGRSAASEDKFPRSVIPRTYDFGFAGALMTKDVALYLQDAEAAGAPTALAQAVAALWRRFYAAHPHADFTYLHNYIEDGGT